MTQAPTTQAIATLASLDPDAWAETGPDARLRLLRELRRNLARHAKALGTSDAAMKNARLSTSRVSAAWCMATAVVPMGNVIAGLIDLYEHLARGEMPAPLHAGPLVDGRTKVQLTPRSRRDWLVSAAARGFLVVSGVPRQVSPYDRAPGITAVFGAGNYSAPIEVLKALFLANGAVVHKPHPHNEETDTIWAEVMAPLVARGALAFADADQGVELSRDERVDTIYFTGGLATATAIEAASEASLVTELGGNNPCIVVPGLRPWTDKEIRHQALHIATLAKLNGGAVCGRPQTLITARDWPQRAAFLAALRAALVEGTPGEGSFYPGAAAAMEGFRAAYPDRAERLQPKGCDDAASAMLFIPDVGETSYATGREAFCQVLCEVALDGPCEPRAFLQAATEYCNDQLFGSLVAMILIDDDTRRARRKALDAAVLALRYGTVAVNETPQLSWSDPWLNWGGNEAGRPLASGRGNFGNVACLDNVEKAILMGRFVSPGHMLRLSERGFDRLAKSMVRYAVRPGWGSLALAMAAAVLALVRR